MALPTFSELLAAQEQAQSGPAQAIQGLTGGLQQGVNLASMIAQRKRQQELADNQALLRQIQENQLKARIPSIEAQTELTKEKTKSLANKPTTTPVFSIGTSGTKKVGDIPIGSKTFQDPEMKHIMTPVAEARIKQNIMVDLPSNRPATTVPGAAAQIQLSSRQGKALIAKPGTPQQLALAASDLARTVQRSAPQMTTLRDANFANSIITKVSSLAQRITANPSGPDVPKLRKQMYELFDDLEKSSRPYVERQLNHVESLYKDQLPKDWKQTRTEELGENIPGIDFQESLNQSNIPVMDANSFLTKHKLK